MDKYEVRENIAKAAIIIAVLLLFVAAIMAVSWHEIGNEIFLHEGRFQYNIKSEEQRYSVEVVEIIKESGKEPVYVIGFNGSRVRTCELTETQYNQYIGDGNNTITVKKATLQLWLSKNPFSNNLENAWLYEVYRIQYPWSEPLTEFTDDDAKELLEAFMESGSEDLEIPFEYNTWSMLNSYGTSTQKENAKEF